MPVVSLPVVYERGVVMTPRERRSVPRAEYVGGGHCTADLSSAEGRANREIDFVYERVNILTIREMHLNFETKGRRVNDP